MNEIKRQKDLGRMWMDMEDRVAPRLRLSLIERAVYCHLLRHTRVVGKRRLRCSIPWLARATQVSTAAARDGLRSLAHKRALRILERSHIGHLIEVRLPREIPACHATPPDGGRLEIEMADFSAVAELRRSIYRREGDRCFYCRRWLRRHTRVLDHVVPQARRGKNSYRNLVACCVECNTDKGERPAANFLRKLCRKGRLSEKELSQRLRALHLLAAGRLRPPRTFAARFAP